jgi:glyoxylase-like metal-dependent hydrolase (beta-lactamase superfamily II)
VFFDYYGFQDQEEREKAARHLDSIQLQPTPVHRELREPEVLDFGTVSLSVVFTPGHTPGHCCFYEEREGILFSADIDLSGFGPWYGHGCSNLDDFIKSIEKCIALEPRMVVTSHNGIIQEDLLARFRSYLDVIYYKEDLVRNALKKRPSTLEELAGKRIFYGDGIDKDPLLSIFERMAIERHLVRLMGLKEVKREGEMYCRS